MLLILLHSPKAAAEGVRDPRASTAQLEAQVSAVGEERVNTCPTCTCESRCVVVGEHDMTYRSSVTAVWLASLRQEVQQEVFNHFKYFG